MITQNKLKSTDKITTAIALAAADFRTSYISSSRTVKLFTFI
jgi:hypothetical protein